MEIRMRPYWLDCFSPNRLLEKGSLGEYGFTPDVEAVFMDLLQEELQEGIVIETRKEDVKFLPGFMVRRHTKPGEKQSGGKS